MELFIETGASIRLSFYKTTSSFWYIFDDEVCEGKVSNVGASDFEVKRVATSPQPNPEGDMDSLGYMTCYYINLFRLDIPQI